MKPSGNTILITGGAAGIGFAFAERFLAAGNEVIICGRRADALAQAVQKHPSLHTRVCDVADPAARTALVEWVLEAFPSLNILVNNAGMQQRFHVLKAKEAWEAYHQEIAANFDAPIHLTLLLAEHLARQASSAIINVTSGLALTPAAFAPVYSATKAGLRSFTLSLRHQLEKSGVEVIEVLPPAVNTNLGGPGLHTTGEPLDAFADGVFAGLARQEKEIGYGSSQARLRASRDELDNGTAQIWAGFMKGNPNF